MCPCLHQEGGSAGAGGRTGVSAGIGGNAGRAGKGGGWSVMGVVRERGEQEDFSTRSGTGNDSSLTLSVKLSRRIPMKGGGLAVPFPVVVTRYDEKGLYFPKEGV